MGRRNLPCVRSLHLVGNGIIIGEKKCSVTPETFVPKYSLLKWGVFYYSFGRVHRNMYSSNNSIGLLCYPCCNVQW